jgi:hypothetical protein
MTRRWLDQAPPSREAEDVQRLLRGLDAEPPPGASERVWRRGVGPAARAARPERPRWLLAVGALATAALAVALWPRALEAPAGAQVSPCAARRTTTRRRARCPSVRASRSARPCGSRRVRA